MFLQTPFNIQISYFQSNLMSFNPPYMMPLARLSDWRNEQTNLASSGYDTGLFVSDVTTSVSVVTTLCWVTFSYSMILKWVKMMCLLYRVWWGQWHTDMVTQWHSDVVTVILWANKILSAVCHIVLKTAQDIGQWPGSFSSYWAMTRVLSILLGNDQGPLNPILHNFTSLILTLYVFLYVTLFQLQFKSL
jgi:hypothetical protein